jgi:flavin reductase (DIM6/NTAB) family NADH-FMN oxidoreductase RutF
LEIDINALPAAEQYKLLSSTIVPRPIALVTTYSEEHGDNAAPFSLFNLMGEDPPVLVLGLQDKPGRAGLKDTTRNIRDTGQYVVHLVDEDLAQAMNICAVDFPSDTSEIIEAGLTLTPSSVVKPKRIVEAPIAFECEKLGFLQINAHRNIAIGKVVRMHVRDGLLDPATNYIDTQKYRPIGRMFGRLYTRTRDHFEMIVPSPQEWIARKP